MAAVPRRRPCSPPVLQVQLSAFADVWLMFGDFTGAVAAWAGSVRRHLLAKPNPSYFNLLAYSIAVLALNSASFAFSANQARLGLCASLSTSINFSNAQRGLLTSTVRGTPSSIPRQLPKDP